MYDPSMQPGSPAGERLEPERNRLDTHLTIVGALHIAFGAVGVLTLLFALFVVLGTGIAMIQMPEVVLGTAIAAAILVFMTVVSLPGVIGGIGLLLRRSWARILLLVVAFVQLVNIPFGTALGVYTLWVLLQDDARRAVSGTR